jgi:hypothetical protein
MNELTSYLYAHAEKIVVTTKYVMTKAEYFILIWMLLTCIYIYFLIKQKEWKHKRG